MKQYIQGKTCYQLRFNVKLHASYYFALQPPRPWVTPVLQTKYSLYIIYQNHFFLNLKRHNVLKYNAHTLIFFFLYTQLRHAKIPTHTTEPMILF